MVFVVFLFSCAPDPLKQSFENAKLMIQRENIKEAYNILKELCEKAPQEKEYCETYSTINNKIFDMELKELSQKLSLAKSQNPIIPIKFIEEISNDLKNLEKYKVKSREFDILSSQITNEKRLTEEKRNEIINKSKVFFQDKKYLEAVSILENNKVINPEEFGKIAKDYREEALKEIYPQIQKYIENENWKDGRTVIEMAYKLNPEFKEIKKIYEEMLQKDNPEYFIKKADDAKRKRKFEEALKYYEKAMEYADAKSVAEKLYLQTKIELSDFYFQTGIDLMEQELFKQAYDNFRKAYDIINSLDVDKRRLANIPKKELQKYYDSLYIKAKKAEDVGYFGIAYNYYKLINLLSPSYPEIRENLKKIEEKIANRALKSLAVIPFKSPKSAPEAGNIFTSSIMLSLYNELKQDLRIIERESMDVLLREYELTVAGKGQDAQKDTTGFQISSADFLLLGDVLDCKIDSSLQEGYKVVRVKTKVDMLPNPEYDEWVATAKKLQAEGKPLPPSPPKFIEKPVYEDIKYKVSYHKKVGILNISYRVVDTSKGKIIHTSMVDIKKDVQDEGSEGVDIGDFKIPFKMAQLPTDSEIMKKAQEDAVAKITAELKGLFSEPETRLYKEAETLERDGNIREAIERYTDSLILLKRKNKDLGKVEEKINKYLDALSSI